MENNAKLILELKEYIIGSYLTRADINEEYIKGIFNIVKNNIDLKDYLTELDVNIITTKHLAQYVLESKKIVYDLNKVISYLFSIRGLNISYDNRLLFYYISVAECLLHEIEHAYQYLKVENHEDSLEARLLTGAMIFDCLKANKVKYAEVMASFEDKQKIKDYFGAKREVYLIDYDLAIVERLANYHANMLILQILNDKDNYRDLWCYKIHTLLTKIMYGYDVSLNPTKKYLEELGTIRLFNGEELNGVGLDLGRRLSLGLRISPDEKEKLDKLNNEIKFSVYR